MEVGSVIFEVVHDTTPPKPKFYIVVGHTSDCLIIAALYINTEINQNVFPTQQLRDLHVLITENDNPFLKYDSFVDCSGIHEKQTSRVMQTLQSGSSEYGYYGCVAPADMGRIINKIKSAHTISPITKRKFGFIQ